MPEMTAGHARGANFKRSPIGLIDVNVAGLDACLAQVRLRGGAVVAEIHTTRGTGRDAAIRDPAGAWFVRFESAGS